MFSSRFLIAQDDNSSADFKSTSGPEDLLGPGGGGGSPGGGGGTTTTAASASCGGNVSPATAAKNSNKSDHRHASSTAGGEAATAAAAAAAAAKDAAGYDIRIKVFDGNRALRKRSFRTVTVNSIGTTEDVIAAGMHSFHIFDEPKNYYITEARNMSSSSAGTTNKGGGGVAVEDLVGSDADFELDYEQLDDVENERLILPGTRVETLKEGKHRPSVVLRYHDNDPSKGFIKIYPGIMRLVTLLCSRAFPLFIVFFFLISSNYFLSPSISHYLGSALPLTLPRESRPQPQISPSHLRRLSLYTRCQTNAWPKNSAFSPKF